MEDFNKQLIIDKLDNLEKGELTLLVACAYLNHNNKKLFNTNNIFDEFSSFGNKFKKYAKDYDVSTVEKLELLVERFVENNSKNTCTIDGNCFYRAYGNDANSKNYSLTKFGIDTANSLIKKYLDDDFQFDRNKIQHKMKKIKTKTDELTIKDINNLFVNKEYMIPKFQRGYVWSKKQIAELQYSLSMNFPIGSFLAWNKKLDSGKVVNFVIDGQQRTQTMLKIYEKPMFYVNESIFNDFIGSSNGFIYHEVKHVVNKFKKLSLVEMDKFDVVNMKSKLPVETRVKLKKSIIEYSSNITIKNKSTYPSVVIKNADDDNIIKIFELLNTKGTPLTNFEILSAKWSKYEVDLSGNIKWSKIIDAMYSDNVISGVETREGVYTPSEIYCLFLKNSLDSIGAEIFKDKFWASGHKKFEIDKGILTPMLWLFRVWYFHELNLKSPKPKKLSEFNFNDDFDEELGKFIAYKANEDFDDLESKVEILSKVWIDVTKKLPIIDSIKDYKTIVSSLSKNLFISMGAQVFYERLKNPNYEVHDKLQYYFINAILNRDFAQSTDVQLKVDVVNQNYLKGELTLDEIEKTIDRVNEKQRIYTEYKDGFQSTIKFIVSIIYKQLRTQQPKTYQFDHIFTKSALKNLKIKSGIHLIGNCGELESTDNASKGADVNLKDLLKDKMILEHLKKIQDPNERNRVEADYKNKINYIKDFQKYDAESRQKKFDEFTKFRFKIQMELFREQISVE